MLRRNQSYDFVKLTNKASLYYAVQPSSVRYHNNQHTAYVHLLEVSNIILMPHVHDIHKAKTKPRPSVPINHVKMCF